MVFSLLFIFKKIVGTWRSSWVSILAIGLQESKSHLPSAETSKKDCLSFSHAFWSDLRLGTWDVVFFNCF